LAHKRRSSPNPDDNSLFDGNAGSSHGNGASGGGGTSGGHGTSGGGGSVESIALHRAAEDRYLNYALSVITSRALPDVRDGLKPVHRRILYTMWQQGLDSTAKHRKCAKVVGDVMGSFHPHGDLAIYEALVRMAQPWVMRNPLVEGSGNFGSLDGDAPAAMRYTECRLAPIASELLAEIAQDTVPFRPNYDGTKFEPVVLPARIPNLLINGSAGIAVGMATNIPPHNLGEVVTALLKLLENPELTTARLCRYVKGPDFPTAGQILNTPDELKNIYTSGAGPIKLRATWTQGPTTRTGKTLVIDSIPYNVNKSTLIERIAEVVLSRKLPLLLDIKDVSTDDVRIELVIKKDADEQKVLAYLFKHTPLQTNFNVNLTCLLPTDNPEVCRPEPQCDLREILQSFLNFRLDVVTRRLAHELAALNHRIHILEGLATVFDALDEIIKIIRASDGKRDAADKIIKRFKLDEEQTDAILELKLYRLAKLEILVIENELKDKRKRAREIRKLLDEEAAGIGDAGAPGSSTSAGRWRIVRAELEAILEKYGKLKENQRRSRIQAVTDEPEFSAEDFIVAEDNHVLVTRDGWVKRQKEIKDPASTRLREGDSVLTVEAGSTRATIAFFSNFGTCYSCRIIDIPASTGYGDPIQKLFKLKDGEKIIAAYSLDPRSIGDIGQQAEGFSPGSKNQDANESDLPGADPAPVHAIAATSDGYALRFNLAAFLEPSTRAGRRYARPAPDAAVTNVLAIDGHETLIAASASGRAILCKAHEVNFLAGPGKGVLLMKLADDDALLGFIAAADDRDTLTVQTTRGGEQRINTAKYELTSRGGKGREIIKLGRFTHIVPDDPSVPALIEAQ
jgi:DNA gyrase subunit A